VAVRLEQAAVEDDGSSASIGRMLAFALHVHFHLHMFGHHHFHGPPIDYGALALAAAASWVGVPGPGEPVLVAAGIFAARHQLDLATVLGVAWAAAFAGGICGWIIGRQAGRTVLTAHGPFHRLRLKAVQRGDEVFERIPVVAIVLAPSWIAGIHGVRARLFVPVNAASAVLWAVGIGLGAYLAGPAVLDVVSDLGWVLGAALVVAVAGALGYGVLQRRRSRERRIAAEGR
jgi:membrane protein DedA with SNARE-associated domain